MKNFKKQYPAQTGKYAVKVKYGRGWAAHDTVRLQISVGQNYHEGEKLIATLDWAKYRFKKVIICVNDTLQRYNYLYKDGCDEKTAFELSEAAGREWIERNINIIRRLPNYEIFRWEDWRASSQFQSEYNYVLHLHAQNQYFKNMIQQDVLNFWQRLLSKEHEPSNHNFDSFQQVSTSYLLEETAAFFLMFKRDAAIDVYPGSTLLPCLLGQKFCSGLGSPALSEHSFTRIDFSRNFGSGQQVKELTFQSMPSEKVLYS